VENGSAELIQLLEHIDCAHKIRIHCKYYSLATSSYHETT